MRKKALKKKYGSRNEHYKLLREERGNQETIVLENGEKVLINPLKHLLMGEKYTDPQKMKYLKDIMKQYKAFLNQVKNEATSEPVAGEQIEP